MSTQHLWFLNNVAQVHVNAPALSIVELSGAPGDTPPLHVHSDEDEAFYVLEGELTVHVAGALAIVLRAGDAAFAPRGVPHVYVVTSETPARWIGTTTGGQFASLSWSCRRRPPRRGCPRHPTSTRRTSPRPPRATASSCSARPACSRASSRPPWRDDAWRVGGAEDRPQPGAHAVCLRTYALSRGSRGLLL